ncbi:hypothetical protein TrCOL_g7625 [Triparma columacea]|uniref:Uncharacterized protein n=1 Tax=Triparma columacea TaxID=722753 RepID=A0A9W7FV56_9STRA|nr:hypothetical protein TrCOL_g7625 [Triparma columacea]
MSEGLKGRVGLETGGVEDLLMRGGGTMLEGDFYWNGVVVGGDEDEVMEIEKGEEDDLDVGGYVKDITGEDLDKVEKGEGAVIGEEIIEELREKGWVNEGGEGGVWEQEN